MSRLVLVSMLATAVFPPSNAVAGVGATVLVVDTTSDSSLSACGAAAADCSLRGALQRLNSISTQHTVAFNIPAATDPGCDVPSGVCTLRPATLLPQITPNASGLVLIDGYTQPNATANTQTTAQGGSNAQLKIVVNGSVCGGCEAFRFNHNGTVRGLVINGFASGAAIVFSLQGFGSGGVVEGCFIGTDVSGTVAVPNSLGISMPNGGGASSVRIGGTQPAQRNVISGNLSQGMFLSGAGHIVLGNLIGTNAAGTAAVGNQSGVTLFAGSGFVQSVGDGTVSGRNVISGNQFAGVSIAGGGATNGHRVRGNFIGTDVTGTLALGNGTVGVVLNQAGNGTQPLVGGFADGDANIIAFNGTQGVAARNSRGDIARNRIFRNGQLGISLTSGDNGSTAGRLPNDAGDGDEGGNRGQNFPAISAYAINGSNVELSYRVDSALGNSTYPLRVEFFKADGEEGRDFLGSDQYTEAEAQMVKAIVLPIPAGLTLGAGDSVVGTATDAQGNTSEFSFDSATLAILADNPDPSPSGTSYQVDVEVQGTSGPFRPLGVVNVSDGRGRSCEAILSPATGTLRATGSCVLSTGGSSGVITVTAVYNSFRNAFATTSGLSPQATTAHTLTGAPPERVTFARCVQSVNEGDGTASVQVDRLGGLEAVSVGFEHIGGTATNGADYTAPASGALNWGIGDTSPRFINVPLIDDAAAEPVETFRLQLFEPINTSITSIGLMEVRIQDNENGNIFRDGFEGPGCL